VLVFSPTFSRKFEIKKKRKVTLKDITSSNNSSFTAAFEFSVAERKRGGCQVKYKIHIFLSEKAEHVKNTVGQF